MRYRRMPIEIESPEQLGYDTIAYNLSESSVADRRLADLGLGIELDELLLCYGDHLGDPALREAVAAGGDGAGADDVLVTPGAIAGRVLADRERILPPILADVRSRLAIVCEWLAGQAVFEWIEPSGGVVGLVRVRPEIEIDTKRFYDVLLAEHGTYVGPGHWFEVDDRYFRLGYGWPTVAELREGLRGLSVSVATAAV